jgi:1,4-dihydroxy-2-naphthoate polyprenyltransferase
VLSAAIGLVLIAVRGWPMLLFGLIGLVAGYSYTGPPFQFKFHALAVPFVFFLMGPLMVLGSYYAITGGYDPVALYASIPIGLLVAAILHANEWRDISEDARAGITTLSGRIGARRAHYVYIALVVGAYLVIGLTAIGHLVPISTLLVVLSLPIFVAALQASELGATGQVRALSMIDLRTARLHLYFGAFLILGLILARYLH